MSAEKAYGLTGHTVQINRADIIPINQPADWLKELQDCGLSLFEKRHFE
jgi:hypothetical protein